MMNNKFAPFYVGQKVICVSENGEHNIKVGVEYAVTEVRQSFCSCCLWIVRVGQIYGHGNGSYCSICMDSWTDGGALWFMASRFKAAVDERFEIISYSAVIEKETNLISSN